MSNLRRKQKSRITGLAPAGAGFLRWLIPCLIFSLTIAVFLPALQNGFVNLDDPENLLDNQNYRGLTWSNLRWMFTAFHLGHYHPLTWLTLALDYTLWGMNPTGYHLTSIVLHAVNAVLFYFVTLCLLKIALTQPVSGVGLRVAAGFSALLFSIHPLRVESVAWATERRDVLSGVFILLTVLCYLKAHNEGAMGSRWRRWFSLSVILYALSLLSKAIGMSLPIVLLVLDVYPLRRLGGGAGKWFGAGVRRVWWEKIPFIALAAMTAVAALAAQRAGEAVITMEAHGLSARIFQSFFGVTFYLVKTLTPTDLAPLYDIPLGLDFFQWRFIRSGVLVLILSLAFFLCRQRWPAGLAAWTCYLAILAPVLGVAQSGPQMVADRYSYLSCTAWAMLLAPAFPFCWRQWNRGSLGTTVAAVSTGIGLLMLVGLGSLTWSQSKIWHDSVTLWRHALSVTPSAIAHNNLGNALESVGQIDEAIKHLQRAVEIYPTFTQAHHNLGRLLVLRGDLDQAGIHLRLAAKLDPQARGVSRDLAVLLARQGKVEEAMPEFRRALEHDPGDAIALNNLGIILVRRGKLDEAAQHFRRALEINPRDATSHTNLAHALLGSGDAEGAVYHLRRAIELNANDAESYNSLAIVLIGKGELKEAMKYQRRVLELRPQDAAAHNNLAITLANQGELGEATQIFERALRIDPNFAEAHMALARVLVARGKPNEAMTHYETALRILKSQRENPSKK